jgi:hypothetical protein
MIERTRATGLRLRWLFVPLFVPLVASFGCNDSPDASVLPPASSAISASSGVADVDLEAETDFLRFVPPPETVAGGTEPSGGELRAPGGERLETTVATYRDDVGVSVSLVAVVHVADPGYWRELQRRLETYDRVLYELVADPGTVPSPERKPDSGIAFLQRTIEHLLELEFQLDGLDYTPRNFLHADMDPRSFRRAQQEAGESIWTLMGRFLMHSVERMEEGEAPPGPSMQQLAAAFAAKDRARELKLLLAAEFENLETLLAGIDPDGEGTVILERRNDVVLERLLERIEKGDRRLAVLFGAAHLPDLERRLRESHGFRKTGEERLVAWDLR